MRAEARAGLGVPLDRGWPGRGRSHLRHTLRLLPSCPV